ncbi:MAG: hypothetical protein JWN13_2604 [Betaproteobacteria bacterium]|jgi:hypothetical protein|nr:hypothetical protein [Betaproteobacteria bacterium]MEA3158316.1 hypothetical protein [Betaproteobacteria bacterium]
MEGSARSAGHAPDADIILAIEFIEVPGRGYRWRLRTADGETVTESPVFLSLQQCVQDVRSSAVLNPGIDPYVRRS